MADIHTMVDGRGLAAYGSPGAGLTVFWHHGTPGTGAPPPLTLPAGMRWAGVDRPSYGESTRLPGRSPADVARDVAALADDWGLDSYAVIGYSGGGPHALACAATDARVAWAVTVASLAPREADGLDWFAGMIPSGVEALTAAAAGEDARRALDDAAYDPEFTSRDLAALDGALSWLGQAPGAVDGPIDDDLAYVHDWGVDLGSIACPVTLMHGTADRIVPVTHGRWLREAIPHARLVELDGEGHVSALAALPGVVASLEDL
ncbi:alpha/beta fold hydrolase [Demequina sp. NBRC 110057]|uniref:alpha/beta fold hydrolase n=1 Tax=Demequina sp. NBRC 110057 TaxID=1570346 RepID=UPI000A03F638|nr:alpha/beta hydrolase [Demequina sp. NBRC 110057]